MEKKSVRLYNVIFPIWILMFWPSPPVFLLTLLGNLAVDCLVSCSPCWETWLSTAWWCSWSCWP